MILLVFLLHLKPHRYLAVEQKQNWSNVLEIFQISEVGGLNQQKKVTETEWVEGDSYLLIKAMTVLEFQAGTVAYDGAHMLFSLT